MLRIVIPVVSLALIVSGCQKNLATQASTNQGDKPVQTDSIPRQSETPAPPGQQSLQAPRGVYSITEVDHKVGNSNVANVIPGHREIQFSFRPDGSFLRASWRLGLLALNENGNFRVENPDQLILFPTEVNQKRVTDGRKTVYKFALSPDGYELKLWGARGNVAVFHRIKTL